MATRTTLLLKRLDLLKPVRFQRRFFYGREADGGEKRLVDQIKIQSALSDEFGSKYSWCKAPSPVFVPLRSRKSSQGEDIIKGWNDAIGTVLGLQVVPEVADQLSGAIYMHSIPVELQTAKCARLADTIDELYIDELAQIVEAVSLWPSEDYKVLSHIWSSDALQALLSSLDQRCLTDLRRIPDEERWVLVFNFCRISKFYRSIPGCRVPEEKLKICFEASPPETKEEVIRLLLLAGFCHHLQDYDQDYLRHIDDKVMNLINNERLTINEISCCFSGTFSLGTPGFDQISEVLKSNYGFRLT